MRRFELRLAALFNTKTIRAERKLGQVCSEEEYGKVFDRMFALPQGVQHVIVQLGNVTPLVACRLRGTQFYHRDSDRVPSHGVSGDHVVIEIQPSRYAGEVGNIRSERVCEQI